MAKAIKLSKLLRDMKNAEIPKGAEGISARGIEDSSRRVKKGYVFVCVKGFKTDGHKFAADAVRKGASAVIAGKNINIAGKTPVIRVKNTKEALLKMAAVFYEKERKKVDVYGVTGTNGKTTVAHLISEILWAKTGKKAAIMGTVGHRVGKRYYRAETTTPSNVFINRIIEETARKNIKDAVMEISSHALDQERAGNVILKSAVITNITRDHLDYHKTLAGYIEAKIKIIDRIEKGGTLAVNLDAAGSSRIFKKAAGKKIRIVTFSFKKKADIRLVSADESADGLDFVLEIKGRKVRFTSSLIGRHNIYNIMAAVGATMEEAGINTIRKAVRSFSTVKGRLERVYKGKTNIFVDYAHTPDSLENVLRALNRVKKGRVIAVFGAAGNRDKGKRPMMGTIAEKLSDMPILTSDNPRDENPALIIRDVLAGARVKEKFTVFEEREKAIRAAVRVAGPDDIVLIAGKGHEDYQEVKGVKHPFDDTKEAIRAAKSKKTMLYEIMPGVTGAKILKGSGNIEISGIEDSSKKACKGSVFICLKGFHEDGHKFAGEAVKRGAAAVIAEKSLKIKGKATLIKVPSTKEALLEITKNYYARERQKIKITGVTGTNGKSTVSHLIDEIISRGDKEKSSIIGTVGYRVGKRAFEAVNTTPSNIMIHKLIKTAVKKGIKEMVMEVSSHALDQGRVDNIKFDRAVVTNITRDHLDYHKDMKRYIKAKKSIVGTVKKGGILAANADDINSRGLIKKTRQKKEILLVTFGIRRNSAVMARGIKKSSKGIVFSANIGGERAKFMSGLIGEHNIYNILAAVSVLKGSVNIKGMQKAVKRYRTLKGRLEKIYGGRISVFIDFAHTPDGLEKAITGLKEISGGRIITVFGAAGNRDRGKRRIMGRIAEKNSDETVVTTDNPRFEDPEKIIKDILNGVKKSKNIHVEKDRKKAIKLGIALAGRGDTVLITGKGHQAVQEIKGRKVFFDDRKTAMDSLRRRAWN